EPDWIKQAKDLSAEQLPTAEQVPSMEDTATWLRSLDEETASEPGSVSAPDETAIWFKKLEASEETPQPKESVPGEELPAWLQELEEDRSSETQFNIPIDEIVSSIAAQQASELPEATEWMSSIEQESVTEPGASAEDKTSELLAEEIPSWLS